VDPATWLQRVHLCVLAYALGVRITMPVLDGDGEMVASGGSCVPL
jgi:hypothetical protein